MLHHLAYMTSARIEDHECAGTQYFGGPGLCSHEFSHEQTVKTIVMFIFGSKPHP